MTNAKRILITTESREIYIVRRNSNQMFRGFCPNCEREVEMLTLDEAVALSGIATLEIVRLVETSEIHCRNAASGHLLICIGSLLTENTGTTTEKLEKKL